MLKAISSPMMWPSCTEHHTLVSSNEALFDRIFSPNKMQGRIHSILAILQTVGRKLPVEEADLREAHTDIEKLHSVLEKEDLSELWAEVQSLAREVAEAYWTYHQEQIATPTIALVPAAPTKTKRTRGARRPLTPIVAKGQEAITIRSDVLTHELVKALRDGSKYQYHETQGIAEFSNQFSKGKANVIVSIKPLEGEGFLQFLRRSTH